MKKNTPILPRRIGGNLVKMRTGGGAGAPKSLAGGSMPGRVQLPRARGLLLREVMPRVFSVGSVGDPLCLPQWVTHSMEAEDTSTLP